MSRPLLCVAESDSKQFRHYIREIIKMACHSPLRGFRSKKPNENGKYPLTIVPRLAQTDCPIEVPCGQCIGCRLERSRQWAIRCMHELQMHQQSAFLTLTYKPKELPLHGTLVKKHLQDFFKRYRRWLGKTQKIRYLACGEYGEDFSRPHYHAIVFGHDFPDKQKLCTINGNELFTSEKLDERWTHGHCTIGAATFETAAYVARYVTKKINGPKADDHYGILINETTGEITPRRIPEYLSPSRNPGIAKTWYDKYHKEVYPLDEVLVRGKLMQPPKFYDTLHNRQNPDSHEEIQAARMLAAKKNPDNTYERRSVLAKIAAINALQLKRNFEK